MNRIKYENAMEQVSELQKRRHVLQTNMAVDGEDEETRKELRRINRRISRLQRKIAES